MGKQCNNNNIWGMKANTNNISNTNRHMTCGSVLHWWDALSLASIILQRQLWTTTLTPSGASLTRYNNKLLYRCAGQLIKVFIPNLKSAWHQKHGISNIVSYLLFPPHRYKVPMGGYSPSQGDSIDWINDTSSVSSPPLGEANATHAIRRCFLLPLPPPFLLYSWQRGRLRPSTNACTAFWASSVLFR